MYWCLGFVFKGDMERKRKYLRPIAVEILFSAFKRLVSEGKKDWNTSTSSVQAPSGRNG